MKRFLLKIFRLIKKGFSVKLLKRIAVIFCFLFSAFVLINLKVIINSKNYIYTDAKDAPYRYTGLVLGASVFSSGKPSTILADRLNKTIELYVEKRISRILVSGDHGTKDYDEVNNMKKYLVERGVPDSVIFTDHAGFDTYNSITRAKLIFGVDSLIIITQEFHLKRAIYIARQKGLIADGYIADTRRYASMPYLMLRESFANIKAFMEVAIKKDPVFFGEKIPIKGDSKKSHDGQ